MTTQDDVIDAEYKPLAVVDERSAPPALFGTTDPVEIIQSAVRVADALKAVIVSKKLITVIQGKDYPQVEAWLTLAAMLRLTTVCEWSRPVDGGWEARVFVRDASGATVGAAEAQCLVSEKSKRAWEGYAIRSMAQTRATSKALRSVLGFIMTLAGYQPTPAEEMPNDAPAKTDKPAKASTPTELLAARATRLGLIPVTQGFFAAKAALENYSAKSNVPFSLVAMNAHCDMIEASERAADAEEQAAKATPIGKPSDKQKALAMALHSQLNHNDDKRHALYASLFGVQSFNDLTGAQVHDLIDLLQTDADAAAAQFNANDTFEDGGFLS